MALSTGRNARISCVQRTEGGGVVAPDTTGPTPTIIAPPSHDGATPYTATINWNEAPTGFDIADIVATGGTIANLVQTGPTTWTVDVTPTGNNDVTLSIPAGAATDTAGNTSFASNAATTIYLDSTPPTPIIAGPVQHDGVTPYAISISWDEPVTGFTLSDIAVTGTGVPGVPGAFLSNLVQIGPQLYSATVTPNGAAGLADHSFSIPAGAANDLTGNASNASNTAVVPYVDTTPPSVTIAAPANHDGATTHQVTIAFSEDVTGFTLGDLQSTNATLSNLQGGPTVYTVDVTPTGPFTYDILVPAGVAQDATGNGNTVSNIEQVPYLDTTPPTVTITAPPQHDGVTPYVATIIFDEPVTGFVVGDINVNDGAGASGPTASLSNLTGGPTTWTVLVTPIQALPIELSIPAGAANDAVGNPSDASNTATTIYVDSTGPVVTLTTPAVSHDGSTPFNVIIQSTEPGATLEAGDFVVTGGTFTGPGVGGGPTLWSIEITPTGTADITVQVIANAITDAAGNPNAPSNVLTIPYVDITGPTPTIAAPPQHDGSTDYVATITFDEPVTGFAIGDISATNGTLSNLTGGPTVWTVTVTPTGNTDVTLSIAAGAATDTAGNPSVASNNALTPYVDTTAPAVLVTVPTNHDGVTPYEIFITFTEPPVGFTASDISAPGGAVSNLQQTGPTNYTATITPSGPVDIQASIPAGAVTDAAGNPNTASNAPTTPYVDGVPPTPTLTGPTGHQGPANPFQVTITWDEPVQNFTLGDLGVAGGTPSGFTQTGPTTYTIFVTPASEGADVVVTLPAGGAQDASANPNVAATPITIAQPINPSITVVPANHDGSTTFQVTIVWDGPPTGFDIGDIIIGGGATGSNFQQVDATTFTLDVTPVASDASISIPGSVATDANGNPSGTGDSALVVYVAPVGVSITPAAPTYTASTSTITYSVVFSEAVTGLTAGDFVATGGTITSLTGSGDTYTVQVTASIPRDDVDLVLPADTVIGTQGQGNLEGVALTVLFNPTFPNLSIAQSNPLSEDLGGFAYTGTASFVQLRLPLPLVIGQVDIDLTASDPPGPAATPGNTVSGATSTIGYIFEFGGSISNPVIHWRNTSGVDRQLVFDGLTNSQLAIRSGSGTLAGNVVTVPAGTLTAIQIVAVFVSGVSTFTVFDNGAGGGVDEVTASL